MYVDPNIGGALFQLLAVIATVALGLLLAFSRQIRSRSARVRRPVPVLKDQEVIRRARKD